MVAMQVTEDDGIDAVRIDVACAQANRSGCAAIDQDRSFTGCEMEARVMAPAGAECVAGANDGEAHCQAVALDRSPTCPCQRRRLMNSSGMISLAGRMKSTATSAVMSATV